jgi:cytidylate kinase
MEMSQCTVRKEEAVMWQNIDYQRCLSYINCQLRPGASRGGVHVSNPPSITISRMAGSGGRTIASNLAAYLQQRAPVDCHWTVFDRNLLEKVLEDHQLPKRIADYMPENHKSMVGDMLEELLDLHPSAWTIVQHTAETILRLAHMGYVILVGRGANIITRSLERVFHVRLIGSLDKRIERVEQVYALERKNAIEFIQVQDKGRRRYIKDNFGKDIDDPLLYHLMLNADLVSTDDATRLIGDEVIRRFHLETAMDRAAA